MLTVSSSKVCGNDKTKACLQLWIVSELIDLWADARRVLSDILALISSLLYFLKQKPGHLICLNQPKPPGSTPWPSFMTRRYMNGAFIWGRQDLSVLRIITWQEKLIVGATMVKVLTGRYFLFTCPHFWLWVEKFTWQF